MQNFKIGHNGFWDIVIFTARSYAKRGICRRRVSVCLSHSGIVSKLLNVGSRKQRRTIAPSVSYTHLTLPTIYSV